MNNRLLEDYLFCVVEVMVILLYLCTLLYSLSLNSDQLLCPGCWGEGKPDAVVLSQPERPWRLLNEVQALELLELFDISTQCFLAEWSFIPSPY